MLDSRASVRIPLDHTPSLSPGSSRELLRPPNAPTLSVREPPSGDSHEDLVPPPAPKFGAVSRRRESTQGSDGEGIPSLASLFASRGPSSTNPTVGGAVFDRTPFPLVTSRSAEPQELLEASPQASPQASPSTTPLAMSPETSPAPSSSWSRSQSVHLGRSSERPQGDESPAPFPARSPSFSLSPNFSVSSPPLAPDTSDPLPDSGEPVTVPTVPVKAGPPFPLGLTTPPTLSQSAQTVPDSNQASCIPPSNLGKRPLREPPTDESIESIEQQPKRPRRTSPDLTRIEFRVVTVLRQSVTLAIYRKHKIAHVKQLLAPVTGMSTDSIVLVHQGVVLDNDSTVYDAGIDQGSILLARFNPCAAKSMFALTAKSLSGSIVAIVSAKPSETLDSVRERLCMAASLQPTVTEIMFNGSRLSRSPSSQSLESLGIGPGSELLVLPAQSG